MQSLVSKVKAKGFQHRGALLSAAIHLSLFLCLGAGVSLAPRIAPLRLPGTAQGVTVLTYYSPGNRQPATADSQLKSRKKPMPTPAAHLSPEAPRLAQVQAAASEKGESTANKSGIGEGDITIALQTVFHYPNPDLSKLPHGAKGDVILNAVIDEHGKISELTLLKGLGSPVDETVIAAVRQWEYTPARKNGVPIASEQELHFHYERS